MAANSDPDHYLVMAEIRERQRKQKFHMDIFNPRKLNKVVVKEMYRVEVSDRFAFWMQWWKLITALDMIRVNIKFSAVESLGYYELKKHKPWISGGCPE
jgi:hypothetical protein